MKFTSTFQNFKGIIRIRPVQALALKELCNIPQASGIPARIFGTNMTRINATVVGPTVCTAGAPHHIECDCAGFWYSRQ